VADLFGANMNSGYYHSAAIATMGLHLEFDIVVMGALVAEEQETYTAKTPEGFVPATFKTATIFGGKGTEVQYQPQPGVTLSYRSPDGVFNTSMFPLAVPQLTVGSLFGTQVTARFAALPRLGDDNIPKSTLWAAGVRHNIGQWFPGLPLNLSASFFYSSFEAEDLVDYKGTSLGAQASKAFGVLEVYGGLAYENSTMKISYVSTDPYAPGTVNFDLDGENAFRFTAGLGLNLGIFKIFADANFGSVTVFSGGIGIGG